MSAKYSNKHQSHPLKSKVYKSHIIFDMSTRSGVANVGLRRTTQQTSIMNHFVLFPKPNHGTCHLTSLNLDTILNRRWSVLISRRWAGARSRPWTLTATGWAWPRWATVPTRPSTPWAATTGGSISTLLKGIRSHVAELEHTRSVFLRKSFSNLNLPENKSNP